MRVLMVSTSYPHDEFDWRGIFIRNLTRAIGNVDGISLDLWAPPGQLPMGVRSVTSPAEAKWLRWLMDAGGISHLLRHPRVSTVGAPWRLLRMLRAAYLRETDADIYHINWLQCALPLPADGRAVLITALGNDMKLLNIPFVCSRLRKVMRGRRVAICPNAEWMQAPLVDAFGDVAWVRPVSFGIDKEWYAMERRPNQKRPTWLAVTRLTRDKLGPLFEWSKSLFYGQARDLHLFGPAQENIAVPPWINYHGAISPKQLLDEWFPRASGLITLSQHSEGRPQVMLEAMAAGVPIVASNAPAHASIVIENLNGKVCDSEETYAEAIALLEDPKTNALLSGAARQWARANFGTWDDCANRYAQIYSELLDRIE